MIKKICLILVVVFLALFFNSAAQGQNMKEGLWDITVKMDMPGMPIQMPPQTFKHCLTKKDMVPQKTEPGEECKIIRHDVRGDTLSWLAECKTREGAMVSNGRTTYRGDTFEGVVNVKHAGMEITQQMRGRWIGQCK